MDFSFTQEQEDLRRTVRTFLTKRAGTDARRSLLGDGYAFDRALWQELAEGLALPMLSVDEERGGSGAGFLESAVVFEELGRDLYSGPFLSTVMATWVLEHAAGKAADAALASISTGEKTLTVALAEESTTWSAPDSSTRAVAVSGGNRIWGRKQFVTDVLIADSFVVWARLPEGLAWFLVDAGAPGVQTVAGESLDLTRPIGSVEFDGAPATMLVGPERAIDVLEAVNRRTAVALAAEMVGGARAALDQSVAWSKERQQFGRPIGSFQAIKHLCADALVEVEAASVLCHYAAWAIDANQSDVDVVASMAKQAASDAYLLAAGNNVQIHGGIGFTWEHEAHLHLRRAKASGAFFGNPRHHRARIADLLAV